ncbi:MAG: zinc ABC transporter substrate-binding protein [Alphaproteobacteria bacterium]|nr:zinc ABC transporter substrate-binding protein [Alphaproteobacteria bacterium]
MLRQALPVLLAAALVLATGAAHAAPRVVTSFKPLQSLAAGVMAGIGEPEVIIHGAGSPHTYALRPTDARELARADVVFWIGPNFESFLAKPIAALSGHARAVALIKAPGISVLEARRGGSWEKDSDARLTKDNLTDADPHIFLDPHNAEAIVEAMAATLTAADPEHAAQYEANAAVVLGRLKTLDGEMAETLAPVRGIPFVVFHDATQYLEHRYGLTAVGSIVVSPERPPGAKRIAEIRARIGTAHAACVFAEPQFESALVRTVVAGTKARTGVLDYVGVELAPGPDAYVQMMRGLARSLADCLKGAS